MIRKTLAALALLLAPAAYAQETKDADPALWVVKDADTTIYLFGTVHVLKPGLSWFDEAVKAAFDASSEVVLEMVEPDDATMQGLVMRTGFNPTGPTLTESLPADRRAAFAAASADAGLPVAAIDGFKPWLAALTLSIAPLPKLGYDPASGAERLITEAAKASNKQLTGLETPEQQLGFLNALPADIQLKYLVTTIDHYAETGATLDKMVANWAAGDPVALGETMNEGMRETPELGKALLTDRNARWAEWIEARMATPGTVFVAVGAGHLAGSDSVQAFLARRNLAAARVAY